MKLHQVSNPNRESSYDTPEALDKYDEERLEKAGVEEAWYWYHAGSYEGSGFLMGITKDGQWMWRNMGHCSCYGPLDGIGEGYGGNDWNNIASPADFVARATDDFVTKDAAPVLDAIRMAGLL